MKSQNVKVVCEHGLHLRVASKVSNIVRKSGASVSILCADCPKIDACSVFQLLAMGGLRGNAFGNRGRGPDRKEGQLRAARSDGGVRAGRRHLIPSKGRV